MEPRRYREPIYVPPHRRGRPGNGSRKTVNAMEEPIPSPLMTLEEAAAFLRIARRTLYRHPEIPGRVRIGHQILYVKEHLEQWIESQCGEVGGSSGTVEKAAPKMYHQHRNPLFVLKKAE